MQLITSGRYMKLDIVLGMAWLGSGSMGPICQPQSLAPLDGTNIAFINLKSPLVLHILDRRLRTSGTFLGLSCVLPRLFLSVISGEMANNLISTHSFL